MDPSSLKKWASKGGAASIKLTDAARSAIEVDVIEGHDPEHDPPSYAVLKEHYSAGKIHLPDTHEKAMALHDALTELSNTHDDRANEQSLEPSEKKFARAAAKALGTAGSAAIHHAESLKTSGGGHPDEFKRDEEGRFA